MRAEQQRQQLLLRGRTYQHEPDHGYRTEENDVGPLAPKSLNLSPAVSKVRGLFYGPQGVGICVILGLHQAAVDGFLHSVNRHPELVYTPFYGFRIAMPVPPEPFVRRAAGCLCAMLDFRESAESAGRKD